MNGSEDFSKFQLQEVLSTYRTQYTLLVQVFTVLTIADVSIIGYAVHEKMGGIIFVGIVFPITMLYVKYRVRKYMTAVIYTGLRIESRHGSPDDDWIVSTYVQLNYGSRYVRDMMEVANLSTRDERIKSLKTIQYTSSNTVLTVILYILIISHAVGPILLHFLFNIAFF